MARKIIVNGLEKAVAVYSVRDESSPPHPQVATRRTDHRAHLSIIVPAARTPSNARANPSRVDPDTRLPANSAASDSESEAAANVMKPPSKQPVPMCDITRYK